MNKVIENLHQNRMKTIVAENKQEVIEILRSIMPEGSRVTHGGSVTLEECGIPAWLRKNNYQYLDRTAVDNPREVYLSGYGADFFLTSANAVTENGELYNVDGNSNRISAIAYGPQKVIVIVGKNKIVPDITAAVYRVKSLVAPRNAARLHCPTYCAKNGRCVSLLKDNPMMTDGCSSDRRICRNYLISGPQMDPERITVILVKEDLGY
ncbi:MAG: lactate utilization protein [Clostridia bacterium]|nr:lactate utilization protein [Clostridia bacterium]